MKPPVPLGPAPRGVAASLLATACLVSCQRQGSYRDEGPTPPRPAAPAGETSGLALSWAENMLTVRGEGLPADGLKVWYLEAYCRSGSTAREWAQTVIPHRTELLEASADRKRLKLRCEVEGGVEVLHEITAGADEVDFRVTATHHGGQYVDAVWVQPCMRVGSFTGRTQEDYIERSFIFADGALTTLDRTHRTTDALYRGGQVYVPRDINRDDVNPRPLSSDEPANGLIGCFSEDGKRLLAMAWEPYQELFQGVIVCLHSDFRLGGLEPGQTKTARGKIYLVENDAEALVERYQRDFQD